MKKEVSQVTKIKLSEIDGIDPITVILEDIELRKGKIIIECYGKSWSSYWGGMGERTIAEFFCSCDNHYLAKNLSDIQCSVEDFSKYPAYLKKGLLEKLKEDEVTNEDYDELVIQIDDCDFEQPCMNNELFQKCLGDEWFYHSSLPTKINPDYAYLCRIIDAVKAGLKE